MQKCMAFLQRLSKYDGNTMFYSKYREDQFNKATNIKTIVQVHPITKSDIRNLLSQVEDVISKNKSKYLK